MKWLVVPMAEVSQTRLRAILGQSLLSNTHTVLFSLFLDRILVGVKLGSTPWQKMKAILGFCLISRLHRLDVRMRLFGQVRPVSFSSGSDIAMFIEVFVKDEYALPKDILPQTILDLGANVGFASLSFACRFPLATVCALEPDPQNLPLLKENCAGTNIRIISGAVGGQGGARSFFSAPGQGMSSSFLERGSTQKLEVRVFTVASLLAQAGWSSVDLIKFDVEGAEWEVFQGMDLSSVKALIGEYHEDLVGKPLAEFLKLFPGYHAETRLLTTSRYSVFLRRIEQ